MIRAEIQQRLGLAPGMNLVVEECEKDEICLRVQTQFPELVDKEGVLVVRSEATGGLTEAVERERLTDLPLRRCATSSLSTRMRRRGEYG